MFQTKQKQIDYCEGFTHECLKSLALAKCRSEFSSRLAATLLCLLCLLLLHFHLRFSLRLFSLHFGGNRCSQSYRGSSEVVGASARVRDHRGCCLQVVRGQVVAACRNSWLNDGLRWVCSITRRHCGRGNGRSCSVRHCCWCDCGCCDSLDNRCSGIRHWSSCCCISHLRC